MCVLCYCIDQTAGKNYLYRFFFCMIDELMVKACYASEILPLFDSSVQNFGMVISCVLNNITNKLCRPDFGARHIKHKFFIFRRMAFMIIKRVNFWSGSAKLHE